MMLVGGGMRVALATTHLPLRDVPDAISRDGLMRVIRILHNDLQRKFGLAAAAYSGRRPQSACR